MYIIQIVPALPPSINGLGDYALNLARQLRDDFEIDTHFVVADPSWLDSGHIESFPVLKLSNRSQYVLLNVLQMPQDCLTVLLHYVGYGYAKRGCPDWLVSGLSKWKANSPKVQLITMFHEVAASGPPWTSAFWLSGLQHQLAKRLVQTSDRVITSKRSYAELLQCYAPGRFDSIPTLPVFSTVGEPQNPSSLAERTRRLVIFGGRSQRSKVYKNSFEQLRQICSHLDIQHIFDIGPPLDSLPPYVGTVPITANGCLPSEAVSAILSDSIAGFFSYHPAFLGKSTILAAYCAHRVIPVSATMSEFLEEGLQPGKHYALPSQYNTEKCDMVLMQAIADNAYHWYQSHCLASQTQIFAAHVLENITI